MSGTPFKMKGHTLPGPNQASPVKQTEQRTVRETRKEYRGRVKEARKKYGRGSSEVEVAKAAKKLYVQKAKTRRAISKGKSEEKIAKHYEKIGKRSQEYMVSGE